MDQWILDSMNRALTSTRITNKNIALQMALLGMSTSSGVAQQHIKPQLSLIITSIAS